MSPPPQRCAVEWRLRPRSGEPSLVRMDVAVCRSHTYSEGRKCSSAWGPSPEPRSHAADHHTRPRYTTPNEPRPIICPIASLASGRISRAIASACTRSVSAPDSACCGACSGACSGNGTPVLTSPPARRTLLPTEELASPPLAADTEPRLEEEARARAYAQRNCAVLQGPHQAIRSPPAAQPAEPRWCCLCCRCSCGCHQQPWRLQRPPRSQAQRRQRSHARLPLPVPPRHAPLPLRLHVQRLSMSCRCCSRRRVRSLAQQAEARHAPTPVGCRHPHSTAPQSTAKCSARHFQAAQQAEARHAPTPVGRRRPHPMAPQSTAKCSACHFQAAQQAHAPAGGRAAAAAAAAAAAVAAVVATAAAAAAAAGASEPAASRRPTPHQAPKLPLRPQCGRPRRCRCRSLRQSRRGPHLTPGRRRFWPRHRRVPPGLASGSSGTLQSP
eukprot:357701-Chlamydomonas_euryale.AAC.2